MPAKTGAKGTGCKILEALGRDSKGLKATELKHLLHCDIKSALIALRKADLIRQSKKYEPYLLTDSGKAQVRASSVAAKGKKPGAPKNGIVTNGVTKLVKPTSMSKAMFDELSREHVSAERRAEAIENLLHNWPR
jgi:hypothetical protein